MERVAPLMTKIIGLMDPIQALGYTDDQKVELAIDASIAIPNSIFIAGITMYSKSLPLVMRLIGLIPPVIIANLETTRSTIICIFNNLKKFQKLEEGREWAAIKINENGKGNIDGDEFEYREKISSSGFWKCDSPGLTLEDQNRREEAEQHRLIKEGNARDERKKKAEEMRKQIEIDNAATAGKIEAAQAAAKKSEAQKSP